jgi:hypothetical protein
VRADWHTRWRRDALATIAAVIDTQWSQAPRSPRTRPMTRARGQRLTLQNDDYASAAEPATRTCNGAANATPPPPSGG